MWNEPLIGKLFISAAQVIVKSETYIMLCRRLWNWVCRYSPEFEILGVVLLLCGEYNRWEMASVMFLLDRTCRVQSTTDFSDVFSQGGLPEKKWCIQIMYHFTDVFRINRTKNELPCFKTTEWKPICETPCSHQSCRLQYWCVHGLW